MVVDIRHASRRSVTLLRNQSLIIVVVLGRPVFLGAVAVQSTGAMQYCYSESSLKLRQPLVKELSDQGKYALLHTGFVFESSKDRGP